MHRCLCPQLELLRRSAAVSRCTASFSYSLSSMRVTRASKRHTAEKAVPDAPCATAATPPAAAAASGPVDPASAHAILDAALPSPAGAAIGHRSSIGLAVAAATATSAAAKPAGSEGILENSEQQAARPRRKRRPSSIVTSDTETQATRSGQMRTRGSKQKSHTLATDQQQAAVEEAEAQPSAAATALPPAADGLIPSRRRRKATTASPVTAGAHADATAAGHGPQPTATRALGAAAAVKGMQLIDLGDVVIGELVKRPSATVKTPYVSDVRLPDASIVLAHTPSLDGAGLIVPGSRVYMTANAPRTDKQQAIKTTHAIQLAEDVRDDGLPTVVGAHPSLAERIADAAVQQHLLPLQPQLQGYTTILKQQTLGLGRFDFVLCYEDGRRLLVEVKNVVCADFPVDQVPANRGKNSVYLSHAQPYHRTALFPIGSNKKGIGVVSDRAIKHLHELTQLQQAGQDSEGRPVQCVVLFIVNRSDCAAFRPCHEADMMFSRMLYRAQQQGVLVMAHDVHWEAGKAFWGKQLPVVYADGVVGDEVDEEHLLRVLDFNATDPRTHWKKAKQKQ